MFLKNNLLLSGLGSGQLPIAHRYQNLSEAKDEAEVLV